MSQRGLCEKVAALALAFQDESMRTEALTIARTLIEAVVRKGSYFSSRWARPDLHGLERSADGVGIRHPESKAGRISLTATEVGCTVSVGGLQPHYMQ